MSSKMSGMLDSHKDIAMYLGMFIGQWTLVEHNLVSLLEIALGIRQRKAKTVFMSFNSVSSKIELIERLILNFGKEGDCREKILSLLREAESLNSARNLYVHGTWLYEDDSGKALSLAPARLASKTKELFRPTQLVTLDALMADHARASELNGEFGQLFYGKYGDIEIADR